MKLGCSKYAEVRECTFIREYIEVAAPHIRLEFFFLNMRCYRMFSFEQQIVDPFKNKIHIFSESENKPWQSSLSDSRGQI